MFKWACLLALTLGLAGCTGGTPSAPSTTTTPTPTTAAATLSLSGRVSDSTTTAGIAAATVTIVGGPNAGKSTTTDPSGNYNFTTLQPSGLTVTASANNYVSLSESVTLTTNQALSFQLTPLQARPGCSYAISVGSTIEGYPYGGAFQVAVTTGSDCPWSVAANVPWVHVQTPVSGSGNGLFTFLMDVNASGATRIGTVSIANLTVTLNQTAVRSAVAITFNGLGANGAPVSSYVESGFAVSALSGPWVALTTYGNPAPSIVFNAAGGMTVTGEIRVSAGGSTFLFQSVDLYSSTTPIPYTITGIRGSSNVFSFSGTVPNTFGTFRTVSNPGSAGPIDTLSIVLTNSAAPCCANPMGVDNIALLR